MITTIAITALIGVIIGILSGLLGIGGGTVMVPLFRLAFEMSAIASTASSLFAIIPTSISGAVSHVRGKTCIPKLGLILGLGGACTSPVGVWLASASPDWAIMVAAALVIGYSAVTMFQKALKAPRGLPRRAAATGAMAGQALEPAASSPVSASAQDQDKTQEQAKAAVPSGVPSISSAQMTRRFTASDIAKGLGIGALAGLLSGYVGVGGGFIMVPLMLAWLNIPMRLASGTSLIAVMILVVPGVVEQALLGNINYIASLSVALGSVPGAVIGAKLVPRIPERLLRFIFSGFLVVVALMLVVKEIGF